MTNANEAPTYVVCSRLNGNGILMFLMSNDEDVAEFPSEQLASDAGMRNAAFDAWGFQVVEIYR